MLIQTLELALRDVNLGKTSTKRQLNCQLLYCVRLSNEICNNDQLGIFVKHNLRYNPRRAPTAPLQCLNAT